MNTHRCLILGGAGFIGSRTALRLVSLGHHVRLLDCLDPQIHGQSLTHSATLRAVWDHCEVQCGDIRDPQSIERALQDVDTVFHFAAGTGTGQSMYQIRQYSDHNVTGTAVLAEQLIRVRDRIRRVVVSSSRAVYGEGAYHCPAHGRVFPTSRTLGNLDAGRFNPVCPQCSSPLNESTSCESDPVRPTSVYGITKYAQEQLVLNLCGALGIPSVALRYQNVYGPGQSLKNPYTGILSIFSQLLLQNRPINVFEDGLATRDFVYVDDIVEYNVRAAFSTDNGSAIYNVGTGNRQSLLDVVNGLARAYAKTPKYTITGQFRIGDIRHAAADLRNLRAGLGDHSFRTFEQGIAEFAAWVSAEGTDGTLGSDYVRSLNEMAQSGLLKGGNKLES
jgi:dTDP-L-rhamnose 4-epimerase